MDGMKNPMERIREIYEQLSNTQRKIADFVLKTGDGVCFLSLTQLSQEAGVTSVTVVNFCKKLGYSSFSDFKKGFQYYIQGVISPRHVVKSDLADYQARPEEDFLQQVMAHEMNLMSDTFTCLGKESLIQAAELLCKARRVYLVGKGLSLPVIDLFLSRLDFLCLDAKKVSFDNLNLLPNRLANAGPEDVFVVFSFPNYSPIIGEVAHSVKEQLSSRIICITDKPTAPPACYADILLLCQTSGLVYYNSMTTPTSLVTILTSLMAVKVQGQASPAQEKIPQLAYLRKET
ncbi:MurR/RpiR family transcriptional regulator [Colidextribacter sp. OB.20]|uniref:MurR/RpiR family transcriptional regulator n=1 Tax=Colidextribacter sp. OB.20 TaxID=2304568 RepID=UPI001367E4CE|nr:MurR/RpiR family transcriptional regulator [Colidextribacter sp. OB.20]NBI08921.1 MurR/RpiR family transcriptional regulator [Colidextribacter sp. OB.20]